MSKFTIGSLQIDLEVSNNLERLEHETRRIMAKYPWLDMLVFGELATHGGNADSAEEFPGPTEQRFCELARELGVWLIPGSLFERAENNTFNTASVIDPAGDVVGRYRKLFPWYPFEKDTTPGSDFLVFDVPDAGRFGVSICYDIWFPEVSRALAWLGAEAIINVTATYTPDRELDSCMARANALANQCYVLDACNAGKYGNGRTMLVGPEGDIVYQAGTAYELIPLRLDLDRVREVRRNGTMHLGQPLKSLRDSTVRFPQYGGAPVVDSPSWSSLGTLRMAGQG